MNNVTRNLSKCVNANLIRVDANKQTTWSGSNAKTKDMSCKNKSKKYISIDEHSHQ